MEVVGWGSGGAGHLNGDERAVLPSNKEGGILQDGNVDNDGLVGLDDDDDDDERLTKASLGHWVD